MWRLSLLALVFMNGCSGEYSDNPKVRKQLLASTWALRRVQTEAVPSGHEQETATFRFTADHGIEGSSNCNRVVSGEMWSNILGYEFRWRRSEFQWSVNASGIDGSFRANPVVITAAGCPYGIANHLGERFWKLMLHATTWSLHGKILRIRFADGSSATLVPVDKAGSA